MKRLFLLQIVWIVCLAFGQTDSVGIYAEQDGKLQLLEPLNFSRTKINALGSALSYGIASTKLKYEYAGATSPFQLSSPAKFRIMFGNVPPTKLQRYYMFAPSYSVRDFSVARLDVKKKKRLLTGGKVSIWGGTSFGAEQDDDIIIKADKVREGVYDLTVTAEAGEYCFFFSLNGTGAYNTVFDFTIK